MKKTACELPPQSISLAANNIDETTVASWTIAEDGRLEYIFPPGLKNAKQINWLRDEVVILMDNGKIICWKPRGGQSDFGKHLEKLNNVSHLKIGCKSVFVWYTNGLCECHYQASVEEVGIIKIGENIQDVLVDMMSEKQIIILNEEGLFKLFYLKENNNEDESQHDNLRIYTKKTVGLINELIDVLLSKSKDLSTKYKNGYFYCHDEGAVILWIDNNKAVHLEQAGKPYRDYKPKYPKKEYRVINRLTLPNQIGPVDDICPCGFYPHGNNYMILQNGNVRHLDLLEGKIEALPDHTALKALKSPVSSIKWVGSANKACVFACSENGRGVLITAFVKENYVPDIRYWFKKKSVSPEFLFVKDAIFVGDDFIGIVKSNDSIQPRSEQSAVSNLLESNITGKLYIWGKGESRDSVEIARTPENIHEVKDAVVLDSLGHRGWLCIMPDGSINGRDMISDHICPSWYPTDFVALEIDNGIVATRKNGEKWRWGYSKMRSNYSVTLEELAELSKNSAHAHLKPPEGLINPKKLIKAGDIVVAIA